MHVCKSHTLYAYYNANNGFENYHFDRTMLTLLTVIAQKFLNTQCLTIRLYFQKKKKRKEYTHETKNLSKLKISSFSHGGAP